MTTHDAHQPFLDAIIAAIHDDSPRLQYADWLEENGNEARAEFIRVQCELARMPEPEAKTYRPLVPTAAYHEGEGVCVRCTDDAECRYHVWSRRERQLLSIHWQNWGPLPEHPLEIEDWSFRRGFVAEITLRCEEWLAHRETLLRTVPLEKVTLTDLPEWFTNDRQSTIVIRRGLNCLLVHQTASLIETYDLSFAVDYANRHPGLKFGDSNYIPSDEENRILFGRAALYAAASAL